MWPIFELLVRSENLNPHENHLCSQYGLRRIHLPKGLSPPTSSSASLITLGNLLEEKTCNHSKLGGYLARSIVSKVKSWRIRLEGGSMPLQARGRQQQTKWSQSAELIKAALLQTRKPILIEVAKRDSQMNASFKQGCRLLWKLTTQPKITGIHAF